ncbi:major facilitator superfamily domain-containing protein [Microdochium trichocladiopsis]|uniref:Major facilitator superfamily domain-containing protein n=1 Tax=Microdochium trichocladiopsis TaxID=1682393 RepID=A0A9P8YFG7_9PEZI|nr:major facilitator superfamily domain-containing protein [Microdochium trichocladiopsis]KAH7038358.1 major facilitator superfamily domain-containing protein [Microdochium trichocladiopsis]
MATQTQTLTSSAESISREHGAVTIPLQVLETTLSVRSRTLQHKSADTYSALQKVATVLQLSGVNLCSSAINGLVVVGLPTITADLALPESLAFWPTSATSLGTAATLLLAGSIADAFGARACDLLGCLMISAFLIGAATASTGVQLVAMRAVQGVGIALHLSSSVALVAQAFPKGKGRNMAFACLGLSQPLGFSFGLVIGGVLIDAAGWRVAYYLYAGICTCLFFVGLWALPHSPDKLSFTERIAMCRTKMDWLGSLLASAFMAILCYLLAVLSVDTRRIQDGDTIALLCIGLLLLPCFVAWMHRQKTLGRPALIPNALWRNPSFSCICGITAFAFSAVNAMELFCNLYFQGIQHLSALQSSLRIVPSLVVGVLVGLVCGLLVDRFRALWLISISAAMTALSPLLMAVVDPQWPYWQGAFAAQLLCPLSANILFTVGLSIISEVFPEDTQALAGAVFNTSAQFGTALGLAVLQIISSSVTKTHLADQAGDALLHGYRASFWALFGFMLACVLLSILGLRRVGRVGVKQE